MAGAEAEHRQECLCYYPPRDTLPRIVYRLFDGRRGMGIRCGKAADRNPGGLRYTLGETGVKSRREMGKHAARLRPLDKKVPQPFPSKPRERHFDAKGRPSKFLLRGHNLGSLAGALDFEGSVLGGCRPERDRVGVADIRPYLREHRTQFAGFLDLSDTSGQTCE